MNYGDVVTYRNVKNFNIKEKSNFLSILSSVFIFLMILSTVSALTQTYSKNGDAFSSATGEYATSAHCLANNTCTWINGSQVILGVYTGGFNGGSATWTFNVTQPVSQITSAEVKVSWPRVYGKGLHSVGSSTTSTVRVGSTTIASPVTSTAISCGTGDQYAYACFDAVPTYSVPVSAISSSTNVTISVPANTLWDVGTVQLVINYSEPVACSTNSQCGANDWIAGTNTCSTNDVYQNFKTYTCNNAGTTSSYCSNSTALTLKTDCLDTTYGSWTANYCSGTNVVKTRDVYNKGCTSGACTQSTTQETQTVQACTNGCTSGTCNSGTIICSTNSQCGTNDWVAGTNTCSSNDVYQNFKTYTCNNPGTTSSSCSDATVLTLKTDCGDTTYGSWGANYCSGSNVMKSRDVYNKGCSSGACTQSTTTENQTVQTCANGCTSGACNGGNVTTQVYDFTTNPASFTTNIPYYPVTGKVTSTTKTVYVNYGGVDYNTLIDIYAKDYFAVVPLNAGTNNITVKVVDVSNAVTTTTKQIIYDSTYSTSGRELIYANTNYYLLPDIAHHVGVVVIDSKRNAFLGIIPDKTIQGITPDGTRMVINGEWYSTATNASAGSFVPNYVSSSSAFNKILFSNNGYAYYQKYKLNLATNVAVQMGTFGGFNNIASLSSDGTTIAYYNNSSSQGFVNTSTYVVTSANFNPNNGYHFSNLEISPDKKFIVATSSGSGGAIVILPFNNLSDYTVVDKCGDWPLDITFSSDSTKAFVGCEGNLYYGAGGVEIIDLTNLSVKGSYNLFGASSVSLTKDARIYASGTIARQAERLNGNVSAHGIYELSLNANSDGFNASKVFFVNLIGNIDAAGNQYRPRSYDKGYIFIKEGSVTCSVNSDCGTNGLTGTPFCQSNNVYQNYTTYTCSSPGTSSSQCSSSNTPQLKETCNAGCSGGMCNTTTTGIQIVNGKIRIDGAEFLIKGVDYAPWLQGTGPDATQWQKPFPTTRTEDVTALVTSNSKVNVTDYSGDGRIQAWEVIKFDVLTMKKIGANTIRTYASGSWHDKDLDGIQDVTTNPDTSEIVQGDMTDWVLDELLTQAQANNMKVIIGYWVQEENFKETPLVANWDDLLVAKQAFGRVVNKYKSNPAVLGWGIGNEVNGSFNQGWFSWGVNVNDYLNALFAYTRTLDTTHPIIYAKYIGENTNFNNLTADIMSINAYIFSANDLVNKYGEFNIPAPAGKAYMLGEFGHILDQAEAQWELSKNYAGGAFLEYNDVWWKGDGQGVLGIVDQYRAINTERYNELNRLFGGAPVCSTNTECGTDVTGANTCNGNQVVRTDTIFTCNNPGTQSSSCSTTNPTQVIQTCANGCSNGACIVPIACSTNAQCGINDWVIGTNSCSTNDVYQNFKTYTCNNPGTVNSTCSNSIVFKLKQDCGDTTTSDWGANYCNGKNVEKSRTIYNKGCASGACTQSTTTETQLVQTCANNCLNGSCTAVCSTASQCGVNGYLNTPTCSGIYVKDMYRTYKCNNPGTPSSTCSFTDLLKTKFTCSSSQICSEGACVVPNCKYDSQCNDKNVLTLDKCVNPNTLNSICTNTPIACTTTAHCGVTGWLGQTTCNANNIGDFYRTYKCNNPGTINSYCSSTDFLKTRTICRSGTLCYNGTCVKPACTTNRSCGTSGAGTNICVGNDVVQPYNQYTCVNPSTPQAVCNNQQTTSVVETCVNGCSAGKCLPPPCGFNDGIIVSAESKGFTAWDISQVQLTVSYKVGSLTKSTTLTKNGNDIHSGEGAYATSSSCGGICNWISGNQVIVGALDSNPSNWGGKVSWKFDLGTINPSTITKVVTKVSRPNVFGKGLHSPYTTGGGILKLEEMTLANLTTKTAKCGSDWFAHSCSSTSLSYTKLINSTTCNLS